MGRRCYVLSIVDIRRGEYRSGFTPDCVKVRVSPGVRLVTVKPGNMKPISTRVCVFIVCVEGPAHGKDVPLTIIVGSQVRVIGSFAQLFAIAERVNEYGVGVRRSSRFAGV